ncbi:hypothetical protein ENBRE01_1751 [Enteropsectra breve]|nr:hypothetical protein ENBRE01_1751 [Enteropsectra breve]
MSGNDKERKLNKTLSKKVSGPGSQVPTTASNSKIYTDEHKSYGKLNELFEEHCTVCHKYEFINRLTGVNTQAVESMNNVIKMEIKNRQGVKTTCRERFLKEFCFKWNNKERLWEAILHLISVRAQALDNVF